MSKQAKSRDDLETMRLPELRARYQEVVGEATRTPNKTFLIRRIRETLAARPAPAPTSKMQKTGPVPARKANAARRSKEPNPRPAHSLLAPLVAILEDGAARSTPATQGNAPTKPPRGRFKSMTIEELQAMYLQIVGRSTGSDNRDYLIWKIREAEKGRIPVGPRKTREPNGEPTDMKILPLRLEASVVERMDEAWRSRGIKNRMEFFRQALCHYLEHIGASEAAEHLAPERKAGS